jgi:BASS family bile acid:Na+ symporter
VNRKDLQEVALWTVLKLLVLPAGLWGIARLLASDYALPVLVLSGVSSGVTAPFFAAHLGAKTQTGF